MSRRIITIGVVLLLILMIGGWFTSKYNGLVTKDEAVVAQWSQVENVYQRKFDLIPNIVATVEEFAQQERDVLLGVTEARANASSMKIDPANLTAENMAQFEAAQGQLNGALSRLLVTMERYPDLKSNQNYMALQTELEGSENRITTERRKFTEAVKNYNTSIRKFPTNMVAGMFGFEKKANFEASEEAKKNDLDLREEFGRGDDQ